MVKILIQTDEGFYETEMKEKMSIEEFKEHLLKCEDIVRFLSPLTKKKDMWLDDGSDDEDNSEGESFSWDKLKDRPPRKYKKRINLPGHYMPKQWSNTREKFVRAMKIYYTGTNEEKEQLYKEILAEVGNDNPQYIPDSIHRLKRRYKITPEEVGLVSFPGRGRQTREWKAELEQSKENKTSYGFSQLATFSWEKLRELSIEFGITPKEYDPFRANENKDDLIILLRQKMRQDENVKNAYK